MRKTLAVAVATIAAAALTGCISFPSAPVQTTTPQPATQAQPATATSPAPAPSTTPPAPAQGTRENPYPAGSTLSTADWTVTVGATNLNANEIVAAGNMFNDPPPEGMQFIQVPLNVTYTGAESDTTMAVSVTYVAATGETYNSYDVLASVPDGNPYTELYSGGTAAFNEYIAIPSAAADQGVLRVTLGLFLGDDAFVTLA